MKNKDVYIVTLNGNSNFGNRLQNYALQQIVKQTVNIIPKTIVLDEPFIIKFKLFLKKILLKNSLVLNKRITNFVNFNKNYVNLYFSKFSKLKKIISKEDIFIYGSDQIWHPYSVNNNLLVTFNKPYSISYAASFGVDSIDGCNAKARDKFINKINFLYYISVREDIGKEIIEELTGRKDVEVLIDPTMLLTAEEWDKVSKKPEQLKTDRYILNYFLGDLSEERRKEIERIAKENNCEIINIMDKNDPLYVSGPSEFLWLEKHAFLICTDSFHSSVFAILYNRPFIVFDREQEGIESMNSRIDTLINKFNLKNRRYTGKITEENLKHDYSEAYEILEQEREKSRRFLEKALDIEK